MSFYDILTQLVGAAGTCFCVAAYQCKSSRRLVFNELMCALLYVIQYFMLGAFTGSLTMVISVVTNTISCGDRAWMRWRGWPAVFTAVYALSCCFTWDSWLSLLPCAATILTSTANFIRNGRLIRLGRLCAACPMWLTYNIFNRAWAGVVCEVFVAASILLSIRRYGVKALDQVN